MKKIRTYFSRGELMLWGFSTVLVLAAFSIFGGNGFLSLIASLIGVTAILLNAKGNPLGQLLMILFSLLYGIISYSFSYYGEMITYLGMTMPMAAFALITWLRHPYQGNHSEVQVNSLTRAEAVFLLIPVSAVTAVFYVILSYFHTANMIPSTISVTTSFLAVYLTFRRSPYFNLAYAVNDVVLVILWALASISDQKYLAVMVCFIAFFINDLYGFVNWQKMKRKQSSAEKIPGRRISFSQICTFRNTKYRIK